MTTYTHTKTQQKYTNMPTPAIYLFTALMYAANNLIALHFQLPARMHQCILYRTVAPVPKHNVPYQLGCTNASYIAE